MSFPHWLMIGVAVFGALVAIAGAYWSLNTAIRASGNHLDFTALYWREVFSIGVIFVGLFITGKARGDSHFIQALGQGLVLFVLAAGAILVIGLQWPEQSREYEAGKARRRAHKVIRQAEPSPNGQAADEPDQASRLVNEAIYDINHL